MTAFPKAFPASLRIVADQQIPGAVEEFSSFGTVECLHTDAFCTDALRDADVVLVRSVTRVDKTLLGMLRPRFIGSATSGLDHLDCAWLAGRGIHFASAAGCNAQAVAEYVLSCLAVVALKRDLPLSALRVGIIGCGHVGSRLYALLQSLGVSCLLNDPPLQAASGPRLAPQLPAAAAGLVPDDFKPLSILQRQADVLSVHVPLLCHGRWPTGDLVDAEFLEACKEDVVLINTARGEVVDEQALLAYLLARPDSMAMIDVWRGEPRINLELLSRACVSTPHIAGYSKTARRAASRILSRALAAHLGRPQDLSRAASSVRPVLRWPRGLRPQPHWLLRHYDVRQDSERMRAVQAQLSSDVSVFHALRREYPLRQEFSAEFSSNSTFNQANMPQAV